MKSRAARLSLLVLFIGTLGATAYLFWKGESLAAAEALAARSFDDRTHAAARGILDLRAAQQAYVATGQGGDFWATKVTDGIGGLRETLSALRAVGQDPRALSEIDAAISSLQDFTQMDTRAREYARTGQNLLASDLIFSNGLELSESIAGGIERARAAELRTRDDARQTFHRRQVFALAAAAAAAALVILLLLPRAEREPTIASLREGAATTIFDRGPSLASDTPANADVDGWTAARRVDTKVTPTEPAAAVSLEAAAQSIDLSSVAALCTELARVEDTRALPPLLERAAALIDAAGIIVWIADPDGRELNPIIAQGYPPQLVSRLGAIPRGAENATAAAFRTCLLQTVKGDTSSTGAIAAPLVASSGCVGVMAAEVRNEAEKQDAKLAAAAIVAAQLAALVGPPSSRHSAELAGA